MNKKQNDRIKEAIKRYISSDREVELSKFSIAEIRSIKHLAEEANKEVHTFCEIDKHQLR